MISKFYKSAMLIERILSQNTNADVIEGLIHLNFKRK